MNHLVLAVWATPRSCSTVMLRALDATGYFGKAFNEPFSYPYFHGPERLSTRYAHTPPNPNYSYQGCIDAMLTAAERGPVLFKDMPLHARAALLTLPSGRVFLQRCQHLFMMRKPELGIVSLAHKDRWPDFSFQEAGYEGGVLMHRGIAELTGTPPLFVDGTLIQENPQGVLGAVTKQFGIPYDGKMPQWSKGDDRFFGHWDDHAWHDQARDSTGIEAARTRVDDVELQRNEWVQQAIRQSVPYYLYMQSFAIPV